MGHISLQSKLSRFANAFGQFLGVSSHSTERFPFSKIQDSRGSALVMAAIFMLVASVLITVGVKLVANASRGAKEKELYVGEAENVARAGLIDALAWFRRQAGNGGVVSAYTGGAAVPGQSSVTWAINPDIKVPPSPTPTPTSYTYTYVDEAFNPQGNTTDPQLADTIAASIGLVGEYPLSDPVTANCLYWARFEVPKQGAGAMATTAVHDITGERTGDVNGDGFVWSIQSTGYVYKRLDKRVDIYGNWIVPYNSAPNTVVAKAEFSTELRKLGLNLPVPTPGPSVYSSGLYVYNAGQCVTLTSGESLLDGAVSQIDTFGVIGLSSP